MLNQMSAHFAQLREKVVAPEKSLSELSTAQAQMDKIRAEENEFYKKNKVDMEQG